MEKTKFQASKKVLLVLAFLLDHVSKQNPGQLQVCGTGEPLYVTFLDTVHCMVNQLLSIEYKRVDQLKNTFSAHFFFFYQI